MTNRSDGEIIAAAIDRLAAATLENAQATREVVAVHRARLDGDMALTELYAEYTRLRILVERTNVDTTVENAEATHYIRDLLLRERRRAEAADR